MTSYDGRNHSSMNAVTAMIDEGNALEEQGQNSEAMVRYDAAIQIDPKCARAHLNRGNIFLGSAQLDKARSAYQCAIDCDPEYAAAHFNLGNLHYHGSDFELALRSYRLAIGIRPDFADAFVAMGNALDRLGRIQEAMASYKHALVINPEYAEVHFNLGMLATTQRHHEEAVKLFRRAVQIKPDFAQAHHSLGQVLSLLEQLDAAEESLRRAYSIHPESSEILRDLATILLSNGKSPEAVGILMLALERAPTWATKAAFATCVARTRFRTDDARIRIALTEAIIEPWGVPHELAQPAVSLIMLDQRIARCVRIANRAWPARPPKAVLFGVDGLAALAADSLLHALLETTPVSTIEFERFMTCVRHALLETASTNQSADAADVAALRFYAAISRQCFINEYIFDCDDMEGITAAKYRTKVLTLLDDNAEIPPIVLLAVAAYFPLNTLRDATRLLVANKSGPVDEVLRQQIVEPLEEEALRSGVESLTAISSGVSEEVRGQYEDNPYPRWAKLPVRPEPLQFNNELRCSLPFAEFVPLPVDSAPEVLVAGCGTGSHSIIVAQRFRGAQVLAVDLSLSSICYAKRKTSELGASNVEYAQADILKLGDIRRTFDIIESRGVLHHLADPFNGWRILLSLLRPGGFMALGLYSELARRHVVKARELIAAGGYAAIPEAIRRFRKDLTSQLTGVEVQWLGNVSDFYTISGCRDLLFNVQEHRLTLDLIETFLGELGLYFIGFELSPRVLHQYRARFPDDWSGSNLPNWARFEADNPDTFVGMYQFWVQKPVEENRAD